MANFCLGNKRKTTDAAGGGAYLVLGGPAAELLKVIDPQQHGVRLCFTSSLGRPSTQYRPVRNSAKPYLPPTVIRPGYVAMPAPSPAFASPAPAPASPPPLHPPLHATKRSAGTTPGPIQAVREAVRQ